MKLRAYILGFFLFVSGATFAVDQPFLAENKVKTDIDGALSRVIPVGKFILSVDSDISMKTERRLVEGETVVSGPEEEKDEEEPKQIMPGFLPEPTLAKKKVERNTQNRQVYRMIEVPFLNLVRVHIAFDDKLEQETITKAKLLVSSYLTGSYPNRHILNFTQVPMLKTKEEIEREKEEALKRELASKAIPTPTPLPEKEEKEIDPWKEYLPWGVVSFLGLLLLIALWPRRANQSQMANPGYPQYPNPWASVPPFGQYPSQGPYDARGHFSQKEHRREDDDEEEERPTRKGRFIDEEEIALDFNARRKRFLEGIFKESDTFRLYFLSLSTDLRDELYALLKGPAYEKFLEGLGLKMPAADVNDPQDPEERLSFHEKHFQEYAKAKEWQDRQFFGFLQRLNEEQIMNLVHHEEPFAVCVMLRFMKPNQSALVLDALPHDKRVEVLSHVNEVQRASFQELVSLEKHIRDAVTKLPDHFFGSKKEDVSYWSKVLDEAQDQDGILHDIEKTQPEIYPDLAKTRFKLDEAVNVAPEVLKKVLSDSDNEELALALLSCTRDVQAFILERLSPRRKALLEEQLATARSASKDQIVEARLRVTKRFREALG
jgi:FliG C-terminal domain/FliG middle domain